MHWAPIPIWEGTASARNSLVKKRRATLGVITALFVVATLIWMPPAVFPNLGFPIGYYGKFNRIRSAIERRPAVQIVSIAMHRDLTLEDFWITVRRNDGSQVEIAFQNANIRSYEDLLKELDVLDR